MPKIKIEEEDINKRLDALLSNKLHDISRSRVQNLIIEGHVEVNKETIISKKIKLKLGDEVEVFLPEAKRLDVDPENIPLEIVYEDDDILLVNKPSGMVVHPATGNYTGTLVYAVMYHCVDKLSSIYGVIRPGIVHEYLSNQLANHTVTR